MSIAFCANLNLIYTSKGSSRVSCLDYNSSYPLLQGQSWLLIIMKWQVYHVVSLVGKGDRFWHRGTH